jgi:alpha-glucosidase (family GH31 glycosyl hydrolase)
LILYLIDSLKILIVQLSRILVNKIDRIRHRIAHRSHQRRPDNAVLLDHRAFTLDPQRFPHLDRFTQNLSKAEVRLIALNNPGIRYSRHSNLFLEGQVLNAFCTYPTGELVVAPVWAGRIAFPDFMNPKVRAARRSA